MLQKDTTTQDVPAPATVDAGVSVDEQDAVQALMDALQGEPPRWSLQALMLTAYTASPEFLAPDLTSSPQFMTSPMESPWDDFLQTPALGTSGDFTPDILTSPALFDTADTTMFDGAGLFGDFDMSAYEPELLAKAPVAKPPAPAPTTVDGLYTLSPHTPNLDSLMTSPAMTDLNTVPTGSAASRKVAPTGTRKNVTPESLIPLDAPIQPRKYLTPSSTSRKEVPATFARKRSRTAAFGEEEGAAEAALDLDEEEAIKSKRLQNTLAARRSRKRKLEHQRMLEDEIAAKSAVADAWRTYALQCRALLETAGIAPPPISPDLATL
jgi:hypothetical protein